MRARDGRIACSECGSIDLLASTEVRTRAWNDPPDVWGDAWLFCRECGSWTRIPITHAERAEYLRAMEVG